MVRNFPISLCVHLMKSLCEIKFAWTSGGGLLWTVMTVDFTHYILQLLESKGKTQTTNVFIFYDSCSSAITKQHYIPAYVPWKDGGCICRRRCRSRSFVPVFSALCE